MSAVVPRARAVDEQLAHLAASVSEAWGSGDKDRAFDLAVEALDVQSKEIRRMRGAYATLRQSIDESPASAASPAPGLTALERELLSKLLLLDPGQAA